MGIKKGTEIGTHPGRFILGIGKGKAQVGGEKRGSVEAPPKNRAVILNPLELMAEASGSEGKTCEKGRAIWKKGNKIEDIEKRRLTVKDRSKSLWLERYVRVESKPSLNEGRVDALCGVPILSSRIDKGG